MNEVNINAYGDELTIREGKALELREPQKISVSGDINSIGNFLMRRANVNEAAGLQFVHKDRALVIVDKENMTIQLLVDPENFYGTVVTGKLELSDELKKFSINKNKLFTREELVSLLKFSKIYFADPDQHFKVLTSYQAFKANAQIDMSASNDTRGNRSANYDKKVTTELPDSFVLNVPIFKGQEKRKFMVEICLEVTDGSSRFWFESVELHDIIEGEKDTIIGAQLEFCKDLVVINK